MHGFRPAGVNRLMGSCFLAHIAMAAFASGAAPDPDSTFRSIEDRYNQAKTLEADFTQRTLMQGRLRRAEAGHIRLRKPGRMRWEYTEPVGKLLISDGKSIYFYSPATNRAEKSKLRDTDDFRAPMAFLLGKLDFRRDFREVSMRAEAEGIVITAMPKSDRLPYDKVEFTISGRNEIRRLVVTGQDQSVVDLAFRDEKLNSPIQDAAFHFMLPPGAELVEVDVLGETDPADKDNEQN
jgi:outer membrane lipoprotein carrier protein